MGKHRVILNNFLTLQPFYYGVDYQPPGLSTSTRVFTSYKEAQDFAKQVGEVVYTLQ